MIPDRWDVQKKHNPTLRTPSAARPATGQLTIVVGINPSGTVAGYADAEDGYGILGFVRAADGTITTFSVPGALVTVCEAINPAGVITGFYDDDFSSEDHGFVRAPDGIVTTFDIPRVTRGLAINPAGTVTGLQNGASGPHGFVRRADGSFTAFDVPGASYTAGSAINPAGAVTGSCVDASGQHGFVRAPDGTITTFDVPDAFSSDDSGQIDRRRMSVLAASSRDHAPDVATQVKLGLAKRVGSASILEYSLPVASDVSLAVYDIAGRRLATVEQGAQSAGTHEAIWDAKGVARGMYFYRLQAGAITVTKSVLILE